MAVKIKDESGWLTVSIDGRVDAFNFESVVNNVSSAIDCGHAHVMLDLTFTKFLSLKAIKFFADIADKVSCLGGKLVLVGASEKLKYQISTYASLDAMEIVRSGKDWQDYRQSETIDQAAVQPNA